jgi:spermidine/putrescine transport system substrate-binding protein
MAYTSRRKFLQYASLTSLGLATAKLGGCSTEPAAESAASGSGAAPGGGGVIRVLSWPGYEDRTVISQFEAETGIRVEFKNYVGGEQMLQLVSQSPPGTYDSIVADAEYLPKLIAMGAIEPLKVEDFPEFENYVPAYQEMPLFYDQGNMMAIATRYGFYGMAVNTDEISEEEAADWNLLLSPELQGKVSMFDWYLPNMGDFSLAVFPNRENPYDLTDAELEQVKEWMLKLKPNVSVISQNFQDVTNSFLTGGVVAAPIGDWLIQNLVADGHTNFTAVIPKQGAIRWSEGATLMTSSENKAMAMEWIKYMTRPEPQARLANVQASKCQVPNLKAIDLMNDDEKSLLGYVPDPKATDKTVAEVKTEMTVPRRLPVQQSDKVWQDIYNEFKTS